jgi:DNA-binding GntR family transcriptional regulator
MTIDRDDLTPVYLQLAQILRDKIASGELAPRRMVPSTRTLVQQYGVNKLTAAKSLHVLEDEGLVVMIKGKGFYVTERS